MSKISRFALVAAIFQLGLVGAADAGHAFWWQLIHCAATSGQPVDHSSGGPEKEDLPGPGQQCHGVYQESGVCLIDGGAASVVCDTVEYPNNQEYERCTAEVVCLGTNRTVTCSMSSRIHPLGGSVFGGQKQGEGGLQGFALCLDSDGNYIEGEEC